MGSPRTFAAGLAALLPLALMHGCTARTIPGLSIEVADTPDHRAIVQLLRDYAGALEAKDLEGLVALADEGFYETSGTAETGDDYNRDGLRTHFGQYFQSIESPAVTLTLKELKVEGDTGYVDFHYVCRYLMKLPSGSQWKVTDELNRMELKRQEDKKTWRVVRGM
jgi:ketosteroid isomerase-like protein